MTIYYKTIEKKLNRGKVNLGLIIIFSICILLAIYLFQINAIIAGNYQLIEYKKNLRQIQAENQKLIIEITKIQSLPYLEKAIKNLNMVTVDKINYLNNSGEQVAILKGSL